MRVLLLFLDGVGLGDDNAATNPFVGAPLPMFDRLLGGRPLTRAAAPYHGESASLVALDATLGFDGTPQSGTGQAALLTGINAVELHGGHFGPWVPARLRDMVREQNLLARARAAGHSIAFANAYPEEVKRIDGAAELPTDAPNRRRRRAPSFMRAGPPLAALGAGVLDRHTPELERGDAVASEITNEAWRERLGRIHVPGIDAREAGHNLARIAMMHELTLFAHYATDYAGHAGDRDSAVAALEKVDAFLAGLIEGSGDDLLVLVASDHGNIEDITTGHTRNPAIGMVIGSGHDEVAREMHALTDAVPAILRVLDA